MTTQSRTFAHALIDVLETDPRRFVEVAGRVNDLFGAAYVRDYTDAEREQLNSGFVRILLESLRQEEPQFRTMFMEVAIPSFIRQGETPQSMIRWNVSYLMLFGSALASSVEPEYERDVLNWFAGFCGLYVAEVLRAAIGASAAATSPHR